MNTDENHQSGQPLRLASTEGLGRSPAIAVSSLKGPGRELRMSWPDDISTREVDYVLEFVALQMKTFRRIAELREAGIKGRGDLEWNSWFPEQHSARVRIPNNSCGLVDPTLTQLMEQFEGFSGPEVSGKVRA